MEGSNLPAEALWVDLGSPKKWATLPGRPECSRSTIMTWFPTLPKTRYPYTDCFPLFNVVFLTTPFEFNFSLAFSALVRGFHNLAIHFLSGKRCSKSIYYILIINGFGAQTGSQCQWSAWETLHQKCPSNSETGFHAQALETMGSVISWRHHPELPAIFGSGWVCEALKLSARTANRGTKQMCLMMAARSAIGMHEGMPKGKAIPSGIQAL